MKGKLIGYSTNSKEFTNANNQVVNYEELWLTFAIPYDEGKGTGFYSKSVKTTVKQINKFHNVDNLKLNRVYELHYDENKKIDFFTERKGDE